MKRNGNIIFNLDDNDQNFMNDIAFMSKRIYQKAQENKDKAYLTMVKSDELRLQILKSEFNLEIVNDCIEKIIKYYQIENEDDEKNTNSIKLLKQKLKTIENERVKVGIQ